MIMPLEFWYDFTVIIIKFYRKFISVLAKKVSVLKHVCKVANDTSLNSMEINLIPRIQTKCRYIYIYIYIHTYRWYIIFKHRNVTSMRDIEREHRLTMKSDLRTQPDQILYVKLVISFVPIRKLVSAPAKIAVAIVSDLDPQLVPPLLR